MLRYTISPLVFEQQPGFFRALVIAKGLCNEALNETLEKMLRSRIGQIEADTSITVEHPKVEVWFDVYQKAGFRGGRQKVMPSTVPLLRRIRKGQGSKIPYINNLVAISNLVQLTHFTPTKPLNLHKVSGEVVLGPAEGSESFVDLMDPKKAVSSPVPGEVCEGDSGSKKVLCRMWNAFPGEACAVDTATTSVLFSIDGINDGKGGGNGAQVPPPELQAAVKLCVELLSQHCCGAAGKPSPGQIRTFVLSKAQSSWICSGEGDGEESSQGAAEDKALELEAAAPPKGPSAAVTPWEVEGEVDYDKLVRDFGCDRITPEMIERIERLTKRKAHPFLRRGMFFSHRDLTELLDRYERGEPFYLYTGRGPSSESMHVGHLVPFMFTQWLQDAFNVPCVIQLTDDEKFLFRGCSMEELVRMTRNNVREIIACGFDPKKTFIFSDFDYVGHMYRNVVRIQACVTASQARGVFGFSLADSIGKWAFPAVQAAPSFSSSFPHIFPDPAKPVFCLIPQAIDQDPYFRMTRDVAPRLGFLKPALIHSKFFPALQGPKSKMSSSNFNSAVFLTDSPAQVKDKIIQFAFSGGGATKEIHMKEGGNPDVDVSYQYLRFFLDDDQELKDIHDEYKAGRMLTGALKARLIELINDLLAKHKARLAQTTDSVVDEFMRVRPLHF